MPVIVQFLYIGVYLRSKKYNRRPIMALQRPVKLDDRWTSATCRRSTLATQPWRGRQSCRRTCSPLRLQHLLGLKENFTAGGGSRHVTDRFRNQFNTSVFVLMGPLHDEESILDNIMLAFTYILLPSTTTELAAICKFYSKAC
jgi:hypothetical protein